MAERAHHSIGEVLALLQDEFDDVTISKIRFLESQGLLDLERTPSGYRKFSDVDVDRLRWVLRQQREHFLPLRVIKERLDAARGKVPADEDAGGTSTARRGRSRSGPTGGKRSARAASPTGVTMTRDELSGATGLTARQIGELERYGLLAGRSVGAATVYDDDALLVARVASAFLAHGVEPRHLRMYKVAAEREAGLLEQVVLPLMKQRGADSKANARRVLRELGDLADDLRAVMLRAALKEHLGSP